MKAGKSYSDLFQNIPETGYRVVKQCFLADDVKRKERFCSNVVTTAKYNWISFIPRFLVYNMHLINIWLFFFNFR